MWLSAISKPQDAEIIFFSKICEEQHHNEVLWFCRDVLAYKSCNPDVRKHVTDSNQNRSIIMIFIFFSMKKKTVMQKTIPSNCESYRNCNVFRKKSQFDFFDNIVQPYHKLMKKCSLKVIKQVQSRVICH